MRAIYLSVCLLFLASLGLSAPAAAAPKQSINALIDDVAANLLSDLNKTQTLLEQLERKKAMFSREQRDRYYLLKASFLGFTGKHSEQVSLVRSVINSVTNPNTQVKFFYELTDGYIYLGEYEEALEVMNQGIRLLPRLTDIEAKVSMLQGATTLLVSLNAFDEAHNYANRIYQLGVETNNAETICAGVSSQIDIQFRLGEGEAAREALIDALKICDGSDSKFASAILRAWNAVNLIDTGQFTIGVVKALEALADIEITNKDSDDIQILEEAIARGYYHLGDQTKAEAYGTRAFDHAIQSRLTDEIQNASKTMAEIKRAQGNFSVALEYYDKYLSERDKLEQDKDVKNLAYQRVKYDNLDKVNQLELLKFKNNSMSLAQKLQERNNQNLILVVFLAVVLLIFMSILLIVSLKQKRALVYAEPSDNQNYTLTDFIQRSEPVFSDARASGACFSVMLFELDDFDQLEAHPEDNMGHSLISDVTEVCKHQVRHTDQFSRIGDNRFAVCVIESLEKGAISLAERCQSAIEDIDVKAGSITTPVASSFGIAMIDDSCVDIDEALAAAEKALQLAKAAGSRQIYVYHSDEGTG